MREILGVGEEARLRRRWFHDEYFDLFVWQDEGGAVERFELCYGLGAAERALVWLGGERFFHDGGPGDALELLQRFDRAGAELPPDVRREVRARVQEFAGRAVDVAARRARYRRAPWQQREARGR
jgi:hypothetical protein